MGGGVGVMTGRMGTWRTVGRRRDGFTVIEVLVAVVVLGLAYVAVLQSFSLSIRNVVRVERVRSEVLTEMLAFEDLLRTEDTEALPAGEIFLEGSHFRLVWVESEEGRFATLLRERL